MTRCLTRLSDPPNRSGLDPRSRLWEPFSAAGMETIMSTWLRSRTGLRCLEVRGVFISSSSSSSSLLEVGLIIAGSPPPFCCFSGQTGAPRKPQRLYRDSGDGMMTARIRFIRSLLLQQNRLKTPSKIKQFDSKC